MPPPMPNPNKRMTAQPSRPVQRYRPGKAVAEEESSDEEEESEKEQVQQKPQKRTPARPQPKRPQPQPQKDEEDSDEEGFVTDLDDEEAEPTTAIGQQTSVLQTKASHVPPPSEQQAATLQGQEESSEDSSDSKSGSEDSEEEESSSDDEPKRKFQRPTFIKKSDRQQSTTKDATPAVTSQTDGTPTDSTEVDEQSRRLAQTDLLIKDKLERDALARSQGRRAWDDDDDMDPEALVDDTDGLDPEAEHAAWRLRELKRLKRDREALIEHEKEIEELDRRRNLTAEEREKEDKDFLAKQKEEREDGRGQAGFLSRYHHRGAFFQDDEAAKVLAQRDLMGAQFQDDVKDKSALPEYMRVRDMTKLGKKGRTRYKDLRNEDTGRFGDEIRRWKGSGGGDDTRGLDERFLPDDDRRGPKVSGANDAPLGERRRRRSRSRDIDDRGERQGGDTYRPRRKSRSRSRSPRRKRSRSPVRNRSREHMEDKRRRIDATR